MPWSSSAAPEPVGIIGAITQQVSGPLADAAGASLALAISLRWSPSRATPMVGHVRWRWHAAWLFSLPLVRLHRPCLFFWRKRRPYVCLRGSYRSSIQVCACLGGPFVPGSARRCPSRPVPSGCRAPGAHPRQEHPSTARAWAQRWCRSAPAVIHPRLAVALGKIRVAAALIGSFCSASLRIAVSCWASLFLQHQLSMSPEPKSLVIIFLLPLHLLWSRSDHSLTGYTIKYDLRIALLEPINPT